MTKKKVVSKKINVKHNCSKDKSKLGQMVSQIVLGPLSYKKKIIQIRKKLIEYYLRENDYSIANTAKALGKNRTALYREMNDLKIIRSA